MYGPIFSESSCMRKENKSIHVSKIPRNQVSKMEFRFTEKKDKEVNV